MIAHINIGSNLGNRTENIRRAVSLVGERVGRVVAQSAAVESEAWGYESPNSFINLGINVETDLAPRDILRIIKLIEQEISPGESHRDAAGRYCDRAIDLDLICLGDTLIESAELTLPHPRLAERAFVLLPLAEILPQWRHPQSGATADKILRDLYNKPT
ncbi:MAG: 2-amino-4-hydroxy-6-hydroxymethyldihydropteridine diphosphokinase [Bacteroides sp.]|nr:2-amino-4-hydroxy-6-hydroxymethyldihydropteridine diphosphokinase [Bacteroides sp.]MCM1380234.1 2-amino-4-hydroxy-6-hydroxymethyldihydropteridine diphosphokinase [Bacteroides sp.]MCM1446542.1 2-amino-4-hydroxy-6-hydroxymethyldihydropteridine diphosphokinase [Prevotella sp.]